jgi:signal transduction histidine kinase
MASLASRLLSLARLESGSPLHPVGVDVQQLVCEMGENWRAAADRRWEIEAEPVGLVSGDREWLELAVDALIENAVRYTSPGDPIRLSCARRGCHVVLSLSDSGPGFDPADLPSVFDRFWHRRVGDGPTGSGLGLSMAQAAAAAHGGCVRASNARGGGALLELVLPSTEPVHS